MHFVYGIVLGVFLGGFLAYMFADAIITKTVAEFKKLETGAVAEFKHAESAVSNLIGGTKKDI
jgi:hypothetical protein